MKQLILIISFFFILFPTFGQIKRANHWFFGYQAGIDFSTGIPTADTTGKMESIEGSSSISDTSGNLLFYTNGQKVWNQNNIIMPNGDELYGNPSSSESSLIVPVPSSNSLYYLFTTDALTYYTRYSIIDMNLNNGLGDVTSDKNILLHNSGTEELAGTMHCNARDYWVISRQNVEDTLKFLSYLIDDQGINTPIITKFNFNNPSWNIVGSLTFSQDGSTVCFSSQGTLIYIFDFNTQSGELIFRDSIPTNQNTNHIIYSNALSPDASKLYVTSWWSPGGYSYLSQFDLNSSDIAASRVILDSVDFTAGSPNGYGFIGQVRLAPDQRIYVSRWNQNNTFIVNPNTYYSIDSLDVIHFPDVVGISCDFQRNFLYLNHRPTEIGLPNFISNFCSLKLPANNCTTSLQELNSSIESSFYPNPFNNQTTLSIDDIQENLSLNIYNSVGQIVRQIDNLSEGKTIIYRENLEEGIYFFQIKQNNQIISTNKLIVTND